MLFAFLVSTGNFQRSGKKYELHRSSISDDTDPELWGYLNA